jgi:MerR family redox-sensitive transcriptional activator SoxR
LQFHSERRARFSRFQRGVLHRIAFIRVALRVGVPLGEIRTVLSSLPHGRAPSRADWQRLSSLWRAEVENEFVD